MRLRLLTFFVLMANVSLQLNAQDGHYWTEHYGTRSMLLNGTVIGSVEDLGAVYYNPARIAQMEQPAFAISAKVYQSNKLRIEDGLGPGKNLEKSSFGSGSALVSGTFKLKKLPRHKFAYAFLKRESINQDFSFGLADYGDYVGSFVGDEEFSASISSAKTVEDEWMGGSWAYPLTDKWSIGVSGFYSNRRLSSSFNQELQAYNPTNGTGMYKRDASYNTVNQSLLWKIGVGYALEKVTFGLTVTTPKVRLKGEGDLSYGNYLSNVDTSGNGLPDNIYVNNSQSGLDVKHITPWAIGLGAGIHVGKSIIHLSMEYFTAVANYTVFEIEPFVGQSNNRTINYKVVDGRNEVLNFGAGAEVYLNQYVSLFGSFATDFSSVKQNPILFTDFKEVSNAATYRAPVYHTGFGFMVNTKFAEVTLGANYAWSSSTFKRTVNVPDGNGGNNTVNPNGDSKFLYSRWRFMLGFSFPFAEQLAEKWKKKLTEGKQKEKIEEQEK